MPPARNLSIIAALLTSLMAICASARAGRQRLHWIWHPEAGRPDANVPAAARYFRKTFDLPAGARIARADLTVAVDNSAAVYVNGTACGKVEGWSRAATVALASALRPGRNVVAIRAVNEGDEPNPAGLAGRIRVSFSDDTPAAVVPIDATWRVSREAPEGWTTAQFDDTKWPLAKALAPLGSPPWGGIPGLSSSFPRFLVPGREKEMTALEALFRLHYNGAGPKATLWDGWLAKCSLWPATDTCGQVAAQWRTVLLTRKIDAEGYVSTHQHRGMAHNDGWPFPLWTQVGGRGWHFSTAGIPYRPPVAKSTKDWTLEGAKDLGIDPKRGWTIRLTGSTASITTPPFRAETTVAPFIRLNWVTTGVSNAKLALEWTTQESPQFGADRRIDIVAPDDSRKDPYTHIPGYRHPKWGGVLTRLRVRADGAPGATITIRSLITAVDSRHNINNSFYLQGCDDYLSWTGDVDFLRRNITRMRRALRFAMAEFSTREHRCVVTPWVEHDGRSGIGFSADGKRTFRRGGGVGNNYWDLLPFGGQDALATIYYYDAVNRLAGIEQQIADHPEWRIPDDEWRFDPRELRVHAKAVKDHAGRLFWNDKTGRFVAAIDSTGKAWDYGFTFVNCEAVYYGFATDRQARSIADWLDGKRRIKGDTSVGADIYRWQFGPRSTTRRNVEWYSSVWRRPEHIPWGGQVQDGGAVLGFSYYDLMSRLQVNGPDNTWRRLREIVAWFDEVRAAGGYREYYKTPGRGTLQGGGKAGGLGMDHEFFESALVPQVMLYGFLGVRPRMDGLAVNPRLPRDWPKLTVTQIALHDQTISITAISRSIRILAIEGQPAPDRRLYPPPGRWSVRTLDAKGQPVGEGVQVDVPSAGKGIAFAIRPGETLELTKP